jgi:hypothetical protein
MISSSYSLVMPIVLSLLWSPTDRAGRVVKAATAQAIPAPATDDRAAIEGRWDITIRTPEKDLPAWLEVTHSGSETLVGQYVGTAGSARPISRVEFREGTLHFSIPPQWEKGKNDLVVDGQLQSEGLSGTMTLPDGKRYDWTAVRAPALKRDGEPVWGKPVALFNGKNLTGWRAMGENQWQAVDGVLRSPKSGSNLVTEGQFTDFKLHLEFRYPAGSNSGVYLRGRYEVQIADVANDATTRDQLGGIYGFVPPTDLVGKPGEWQSFDITLVGRMVTVVVNGKTVVCNREIPGITGGALDSHEGTPGPLLLQGDHGPVEFRNLSLTPATK